MTLYYAIHEAAETNQPGVGSCEIFIGLLQDESTAAGHVLTELALPPAQIEPRVRERMQPGSTRLANGFAARPMSEAAVNAKLVPGARRMLETAWDEAQGLGCTYIGTEHLLIALASDTKLMPGRILHEMGLDPDMVRETAAKWLGADTNPPLTLRTTSHESPSVRKKEAR